MKIGVATAARLGRMGVLALGLIGIAPAALAQTAPDQQMPESGLELPANLQIFGKADPNIRKPTAIINDYVITGTDVEQRTALLVSLNKFTPKPEEMDQLRRTVLRQLIDETLQIQEAKANEITVDPKEVEQSFARVSRNFQRTPEQMRSWLKQIGSSERTIRRQIEGEIAWSRLLRRRVDVNVSEAEVKEWIERWSKSKGTEEFRVFEIYLNATPDRKQEVFAGMQRMIQQMRDGTPFDYLARTYSEASTKSVGGDLGWIRPSMLPEALAQAAQDMQTGQVAGPIELPTGFSILYLAEKRQIGVADPRDSKLSIRQLTVNFAAGATEAQINDRVTRFATATRAIKGCGDVAKVASEQGAEVIDRDELVIRQLPPQLQNLVLPLQVGQVTQPYGSPQDGVRVLVICGRDEPTAPNEPSADVIEGQIAEQRTNIRAQRMLRDLRRDALIEYR